MDNPASDRTARGERDGDNDEAGVHRCGGPPGEECRDGRHRLFLTAWHGRPVHVHPFSGVTSFTAGRHHRYAGMTESAPSDLQHVHYYTAETSCDDGHSHLIRGTTGPAIPLPDGGHVHEFEGDTTTNGRTPHAHRYSGTTGIDRL